MECSILVAAVGGLGLGAEGFVFAFLVQSRRAAATEISRASRAERRCIRGSSAGGGVG
jgi:hypothetical protein